MFGYPPTPPPPPPPVSPAADRLTCRPPRFGSTKGGGVQPLKWLNTPWGRTLAQSSPRESSTLPCHDTLICLTQ